MFAWEHCAKCKAMVVGLWVLALGCLIFIGWGCSSDTGTKDSGVQVDSGIVDQGPGRVDAVDSGTGPDSIGKPVDGGPEVRGDVGAAGGPDSGSPGDIRGDTDGGGTGDVGTADSLGPQPDLGGADAFTPGVTRCGLAETSDPYFPCCPDGVDCAPLYGVRDYCSCTVQPAGSPSQTLHTCEAFQVPAKTAKWPTRCVGP